MRAGDMSSPKVRRGAREREGRGFSTGELKVAGLNVGEARHLGITVDLNRRTSHEENVEKLKGWAESAKKDGIRVPTPKQSTKAEPGRVYKGLTSAGKKMRGLRKKP